MNCNRTGFLREKTHRIHDRDPLFTANFREILKSGGVESVRLPLKIPNLNSYSERFFLSIKSECLDWMVIVGERHLRRAIDEYVEHYHIERPHQGLANELIDGVPERHRTVICSALGYSPNQNNGVSEV